MGRKTAIRQLTRFKIKIRGSFGYKHPLILLVAVHRSGAVSMGVVLSHSEVENLPQFNASEADVKKMRAYVRQKMGAKIAEAFSDRISATAMKAIGKYYFAAASLAKCKVR